jgi:hypothetical protein
MNMAIADRTPDVANDEARRVKWNREQYHVMGEMGWLHDKRVELLDGEVCEKPRITDSH